MQTSQNESHTLIFRCDELEIQVDWKYMLFSFGIEICRSCRMHNISWLEPYPFQRFGLRQTLEVCLFAPWKSKTSAYYFVQPDFQSQGRASRKHSSGVETKRQRSIDTDQQRVKPGINNNDGYFQYIMIDRDICASNSTCQLRPCPFFVVFASLHDPCLPAPHLSVC
jgi:hypothetical protein